MVKDEQNCSYNGGGDAIPLKIWSDFSSIQYKMPDPLRYAIFREFLRLAEGGGVIFFPKQLHSALNFYMKKNALSVTFLYKKSL